MNSIIKKTAAIILVTLLLIFTVIALLGVWGVIDLEHVIGKAIQSLIIIFVASAIVIFIFTYLIKDNNNHNKFV